MVDMDFVNKILGNPSQKSTPEKPESGRQKQKEYSTVELVDTAGATTSKESQHTIQMIRIEQNTDTINAKDQLRAGNIVIADLRGIRGDSGSLNVDRVIGELNNVVNDTNGDLAYQDREQTHLILTPDGVDISRERL